jgi:thiamine biosynthesis protein ThiS
VIRIRLNGLEHELPEGTSVAELVASLGQRSGEVAIERNGELVRHEDHARTRLAEGDEVELVTLVGGG